MRDRLRTLIFPVIFYRTIFLFDNAFLIAAKKTSSWSSLWMLSANHAVATPTRKPVSVIKIALRYGGWLVVSLFASTIVMIGSSWTGASMGIFPGENSLLAASVRRTFSRDAANNLLSAAIISISSAMIADRSATSARSA